MIEADSPVGETRRDLIQRRRYTFTVSPQSDQLVNFRHHRHFRDQLVLDGQGWTRSIAALEFATKIVWYYVHERVWAATPWGRRYLTSDEAQRRLDDLELADAIIFGAPTYMGSVSGPFKTFMDSTSKSYSTGAWKDKIAAGFTNSASRSGDKLATLTQFAILAAQHGMHWVNLGLPPGNNSTHGSDQDLNRLGFWLGAAAQSNNDQGP
jgi:hypothetical protein